MSAERLLLLAHMQIAKLKEQMEAAKKAEAKAAAFDWLMARLQESYDAHGWIGVGSVSVCAQMFSGCGEERRMWGQIHWKDQRGEPLDLLAEIEKAMGGE